MVPSLLKSGQKARKVTGSWVTTQVKTHHQVRVFGPNVKGDFQGVLCFQTPLTTVDGQKQLDNNLSRM